MINVEESLKKGTPPEILKELMKNESNPEGIKKLQEKDPVKKQDKKGLEQQEDSPMDPPNAYEEPGKISIKPEEISESIKIFMNEHKEVMRVIEEFEKGIVAYKTNGYKLTKEMEKF